MHICTISDASRSYLPRLPNDASKFRKLLRYFRKSTLISEINPRSRLIFRSNASILLERKRHVKLNYVYIIHPFSMFRVYWESVMIVVFISSLFMIPLNVVYSLRNIKNKAGLTQIPLLFLDLGCCTDIVIQCLTGYTNTSTREIVLEPKRIIWYYLISGNLILDVLTSIPVTMLFYVISVDEAVLRNVKLFSLLKGMRSRTLYKYMRRVSDNWHINSVLFKLMTYALLSMLCLHWFACINLIFPLYLQTTGLLKNSSWTIKEDVFSSTTAVSYLHGLFRATGSLLCIRHTTVVADTLEDSLTLTVSYILGYILITFIFVILLQIVLTVNTPSTKYESIMNQLNQYMRHRQLPILLQHRLIQFYGHRFQKSYFRESAILPILSDRLRLEINLHCYATLVENVSILHDLPEDIVSEIVSSLKSEVFLPNDIIIKAGTTGDCMYFISRGTVAISTPTGREVCHLQDGAYFGEIALIKKDQKRVANVVAIEICEMYRLDRKVFKNCLATQAHLMKKIEKLAQDRTNRTTFLEELHKKHILEKTLARKHEFVD